MKKSNLVSRLVAQILTETQNDTIELGGESFTRDDLLDMISDYSKELTGTRDRSTITKLAYEPIEKIAAHYKEMFDSPEALEQQVQFEKEEQAKADASIGHQDQVHPLESTPKRQGMGRRTEGTFIISKHRLQEIIREALTEKI